MGKGPSPWTRRCSLPAGFRAHAAEFQPGSLVIGRDGKPAPRAPGVPARHEGGCFASVFLRRKPWPSAGDEHLWQTAHGPRSTPAGGFLGQGAVGDPAIPAVRETGSVIESPRWRPVEFGARSERLLLEPYLLGLLLGDGSLHSHGLGREKASDRFLCPSTGLANAGPAAPRVLSTIRPRLGALRASPIPKGSRASSPRTISTPAQASGWTWSAGLLDAGRRKVVEGGARGRLHGALRPACRQRHLHRPFAGRDRRAPGRASG